MGRRPGMVPGDVVAVIRHKVASEGIPIREVRNGEREVTVPLAYTPGELAQVDFFEV